ncbi:hypothetical protein MKO06_06030 [Gramella sp. GC03-9]|uniref:Uncharacterized protein n=1 Tax=Christiangramia oceanisediminis TaxID=2920386 RepID=A0A9X2KW47_9FLAO|nr:hypothetical protein [Gramella oceanisediminis]MCP9199455.1 hypothetical protein [Gramella oceanisediminis]
MYKIILLILTASLVSCSGENLYDFKDLTPKPDFIYQVRAYAEDSTKTIDYKVTVFQTNGYNELISYPYGTVSGGNKAFHASEYSVKAYKKNGVLITPRENVKRFWIVCYEVGSTNIYNEMLFQHISENAAPVYVGYDFDSNQQIIEYR